MSDYYDSPHPPGSGVIERTNDNPLIHFGTPSDTYEYYVVPERKLQWWRRWQR